MDDLDTQESVCLVQQQLWALQVRDLESITQGWAPRISKLDGALRAHGDTQEGWGPKGLLRSDLVSSKIQDSF